jgi:acetylornithine/succinyldiaminopimelate/putrescine aminotransferase
MSRVETESTQSATIRKHKEFLFPAVAIYYEEPIALVRGEGFHVWDDQDNKYLGNVIRTGMMLNSTKGPR